MSDLNLLLSTPKQTPVTPKPPSEVTNSDFMEAIFVDLQPDECPIIAIIPGAEIKERPDFSKILGWTRGGDLSAGNENMNLYFTFSTYLPVEGEYRRRKENFHRSFGFYLDDIGTKVQPLDLLHGCQPSYLIETSKDNYHAGYLFDVPVENLQEIEKLISALAKAKLTDPGANGPSARLGRLPCAINGKYEPFFQCRLIKWHPEKKYSIDQIYQGFGLERVVATTKSVKAHSKNADVSQGTKVYSPRPSENPVVTALRSKNLYKQNLGDLKHDITCPWVNEHTGQIDSGTAYFEPKENFPKGGFKCLHGHCADRNLDDFLKKIDITPLESQHKATIVVIAGEMDGIIDAAEIELANTGEYYQRSGSICHVVTDPGSNVTAIKLLGNSDLTRVLSKGTAWVKYCGEKPNLTIIDPSEKHVKALFSAGSYKHLPVLHGIARQPYLRPDGSLMVSQGYDPATGMYGVFDASKFSIPEFPSRDDAVVAVEEFKSLLSEFSFSKPYDLTAAIGMIITGAIRVSLPLAPMAHIKAHQISSGKTFLCEIIASFAGPSKTAAYSFPPDDKECSNLLLAAFFQSPSVIMFDNLTSDIPAYKSLCSALTSEYMTGRILGFTKTGTVATRTLILSSGNNVDPVRDMTRRVLTIMLDPKVESTVTRKFKLNPLAMVLNNREKYVSLALTIVRAYIVAGYPIQRNLSPLSSFDEWTKLVRAPLVWLGLPDPATALFDTVKADPDREILRRLMFNLHNTFGDKPISVSNLVSKVEGEIGTGRNSELAEVVREIAEDRNKINRRRLGTWFSRHKGVIVNGYVLEQCKPSGGSARWQVVFKEPIQEAVLDQYFDNIVDVRLEEGVSVLSFSLNQSVI